MATGYMNLLLLDSGSLSNKICKVKLFINGYIYSFWAKLISGKQKKLSAIIYKCMYNMLRVRDRNFMWLKYVKHILCNCGFSYIWESQTFINELWLKHSIKQNLTD